jgi:hypothetical protein
MVVSLSLSLFASRLSLNPQRALSVVCAELEGEKTDNGSISEEQWSESWQQYRQ